MHCCREKRPSPVFYLAEDDIEPLTDAPDTTDAAAANGCRPDDRDYAPPRESKTANGHAPVNGGGAPGQRMKYSGKSYYELDKLGAHRGADYESRRRYLQTAAQTGIAHTVTGRFDGEVPQNTDAGPVAPPQQQDAAVTFNALKGAATDDGIIVTDGTGNDEEGDELESGCLLTAVACGMHTCGCVIS